MLIALALIVEFPIIRNSKLIKIETLQDVSSFYVWQDYSVQLFDTYNMNRNTVFLPCASKYVFEDGFYLSRPFRRNGIGVWICDFEERQISLLNFVPKIMVDVLVDWRSVQWSFPKKTERLHLPTRTWTVFDSFVFFYMVHN